MTKQANSGVITIKKYANRRLYNTETSCYITLDDLYEMIKKGEEFEVKDAKTDEDLTRSVLTQIIFEQESKGYSLLPISFLRQLIKLYGNAKMCEMLPNYLNISMDNFLQNKDRFTQFSGNEWQDFNPMSIFENIAKQNMDIFENTLNMFNPSSKKSDD